MTPAALSLLAAQHPLLVVAVITPAAPSWSLLALWTADLKTLLAWAVLFLVGLGFLGFAYLWWRARP